MADQPQPVPAGRITVMPGLPSNLPVAPMPAASQPIAREPAVIPPVANSQIVNSPTPIAPMPPSITLPPRPTAPPPAPRPIAPIAPRPTPPAPPKPIAGEPVATSQIVNSQEKSEYSSELRTMSADIGRISTGQAPTPVAPTRPTPPSQPIAREPAAVQPIANSQIVSRPTVPSAPTMTAPIVIPSSGGSSGGVKKFVYVIGALVIAGLGYAIFALISKDSTPLAQISPTPSASATPTPATITSISRYFPQTGASVTLKADGSASTDLANAISTSQPSLQQAYRMSISGPFGSSLSEFLGGLGVSATSLSSTLGSDWAALTYGQKEQFDANGATIPNASVQPRLILISEAQDASAANQAMIGMESTLNTSAAKLFGYDASKAIVQEFGSGTYRQIPIRYHNFPYADHSLDYAIVLASNGKNYLIISGSRESMFFSIDQLTQ